MKRSEFIKILMSQNPEEDIEIVFLGNGDGGIIFDDFGYHEIYNDDIDTITEKGKVVGIAINIF